MAQRYTFQKVCGIIGFHPAPHGVRNLSPRPVRHSARAANRIAAAVALTRFVQAQLYGISAHDPMTLAAASLALAAVACAAGYIPAVCASRIDAMQALRYE